jgi:hypothetical protein
MVNNEAPTNILILFRKYEKGAIKRQITSLMLLFLNESIAINAHTDTKTFSTKILKNLQLKSMEKTEVTCN